MSYKISDLIKISDQIYGVQDDRLYDLADLFYYHQKWLLRHIDDKKHGRKSAAIKQLMISMAWFFAIVRRFKIDLQTLLKKRYSYKCPFCLEIPCDCQTSEKKKSKKTGRPVSGNPNALAGWQQVVGKIYPEKEEFSSLEILRRQDVFHQQVRLFRQASGKRKFHLVEVASVDYFVELLKISNTLGINMADEFVKIFESGCFVCQSTPCVCFYTE